jgi:hypothetical protein
MALESRLRELDNRHRQLDAAIDAATRRPAIDPLQLTEMKRLKLKIKEEADSLRKKIT